MISLIVMFVLMLLVVIYLEKEHSGDGAFVFIGFVLFIFSILPLVLFGGMVAKDDFISQNELLPVHKSYSVYENLNDNPEKEKVTIISVKDMGIIPMTNDRIKSVSHGVDKPYVKIYYRRVPDHMQPFVLFFAYGPVYELYLPTNN